MAKRQSFRKNHGDQFKININPEYQPLLDVMIFIDKYPRDENNHISEMSGKEARSACHLITPVFNEILDFLAVRGYLEYACCDDLYNITLLGWPSMKR